MCLFIKNNKKVCNAKNTLTKEIQAHIKEIALYAKQNGYS